MKESISTNQTNASSLQQTDEGQTYLETLQRGESEIESGPAVKDQRKSLGRIGTRLPILPVVDNA
jgi:hypothetical protein